MLERTYTIPLRKGYINTPRYYKTNKALATLRAFLVRHMKVAEDKVKIGQHLNEFIWRHGIKNPPARVKVTVKKTDDGIVTAELEGKDYKETVKPQPKTEAPGGLKERLESVVGGDKKEETAEKPAEKVEPKPEKKPKVAKAPKAKAPKREVNAMEE